MKKLFAPRSAPASRGWAWRAEIPLAVLLGVLHSQSFASAGLWWLQILSLAVLALRLACAGSFQAAATGLAFGTAWLTASTWWMFISLHRFGGLPAWLAWLAVGLLCALLSLYLAAAFAFHANRRARGRASHPLLNGLLFAAVWLLAELARGALFTGFPWAASGYAHTAGPLAALAPWIGVYGIGFVSALLASLIGQALAHVLAARSGSTRATTRQVLASLGTVVAMLAAVGFAGVPQFSRPTSTLKLTLLQTNVAQDEKFSIERMPETLDWLSVTLLAARGDLVVAPETAIPLLPDQLGPQYWLPLLHHFQGGDQAALVGLPLGDAATGYSNSAAGISRRTRDLPNGFYRYDKHHLVPFGEFIPAGFRWFVDLMNIPLGDFNRGPLAAPSFEFKGERIAPNICYEDLFGEELATRFADPASSPTLFVNISNIAWFGDSVALHQHLEISRMRTLEFQRPMVRSTNTGMTAVIDHAGRVTAALPPYTQATLETTVQGREGETPFARWASWGGLWPLMALALLIVFVLERVRARP